MALQRVREYISQPYEHKGEGKLVRKLGKTPAALRDCVVSFRGEEYGAISTRVPAELIDCNRFLHLDVLLFDVLYELSRPLELGECVREWHEGGVGVCGESVQFD